MSRAAELVPVGAGELTDSPLRCLRWSWATIHPHAVGQGELIVIGKTMSHLPSLALVALALTTGCSTGRPTDFGTRWVRSHPYTLMGLCLNNEEHNVEQYMAAGFNHMLAWRPWRPGILTPTAACGLTWFGTIPWIDHDESRAPLLRSYKTMTDGLTAKYPGNVGWLVNDEPMDKEMQGTGVAMEWIRTKYPDKLVFSNLGGGKDYAAHARHFLRVVKPDVMMYDCYPYNSILQTWGKEDRNKWFERATTVRREALAAGVPYWAFLHTIDRSMDKRLLSESNLRIQLFVFLTYGYTGQAYFIYDFGFKGAPALMDAKGKPSHVYRYAAKANPEVLNIGKAIRFLTSTHVFVAPTGGDGPSFVDPKILPAWKPWTVENDPLRSVQILEPGPERQGLIGYFRDDAGGRYFMLTNLWRRPGAKAGSAANTSLTFRVVLDPTIKSIQRLSRLTGKAERLHIKYPAEGLVLTLPGGTGDLFKVDAGAFPGLK